jgi:hypothetical protein
MINFVFAENFYTQSDFENINEFIRNPINRIKFSAGEFSEISSLQYTVNKFDEIVTNILGYECVAETRRSGFFHKPQNCLIHFEDFTSLDEWVFLIAMEETTFNIMHHNSGARTALDEINLNYRYVPDWDYHLNLLMKPNDALFFRPWLFHSLERGLVHKHRIKSKDNFK